MRCFHSLLTFLLLFLATLTYAQTYPVQVSVSTAPPYYNFLSHYGDQNNHLLIVATLTDFNSPPVNVRLRLRIEGPGYTVQTRQDLPIGPVFELNPGFPVFIQGSDLLPLLQENNLAIISGNPNFNNLPEGFTTICVDVIKDGVGGEVLATNNCTAFFLQLMQPPQLFLPICNSVVDTTSLFQTFQWSPPQNYISAIGTDLNYTFSLYEWIDTNNFNIFQTGEGLVTSLPANEPIIQFPLNDYPLQKGVKYVWRVQAHLTSNGIPIQMITNNGLSAPCSFYYGKPQTLAEALTGGLTINLSAEALSTRKGQASWTVVDETPGAGLSTYSFYIVEYRRKPQAGENYVYTWWEDTVSTFQLPIYQLEPEKTYQVRVSGLAGNYRSAPTEIAEFTTPPAREYLCGEADLPYLPNNYLPLANAHMGDVFQIGQFSLEVKDIIPLGTPGHFKGRGTIPHSFISGARIKVRFDDLLVDSEYNVREGAAQAVTDGVDNWLNDQYLDEAIPYTVSGVIESGGYLNDSTVFVVVNGDSLFFNFDGNDLPIVIHGDNNVEYQFWPDGTMIVTTYGIIPSNDQLDATKNLYVHFESALATDVTFDKKNFAQFTNSYEAIVCAEQFLYFVPNKSKDVTGTEQVKAIIHGTIPSFLPSELTFPIAGGNTVVPYTQINDSTFLLTLPARSYNYQVYANYSDLKLGKVNVKCYAPLTKKVRIVPLVTMNDITEAQIETELNALYKGANLTIDATIAPQFNTPEFTSTASFTNPDVSVMSKYTVQMRALRDAYLAENQVENGTYLVFVLPSFTDAQLDGYMVRGRGVGFVSASTLSSLPVFAHTLAHELGHGIGGLEHAWGDTESLKGSTDNLMDYSGGTQLVKEQWEGLRNPGAVLNLFDEEEDAMALSSILGVQTDFEIPTETDYINIHDFAGSEDFIYKAQNGAYFKFNPTLYTQVEGVYLDNGYVEIVHANGKEYFVCTSTYNFNNNQSYPILSFYTDTDESRFVTEVASNGDSIYVIKPRTDDIDITDNIPCNQVGTFVGGLNEVDNSIIFITPNCPPANGQTSSCNYQEYQTISQEEQQAVTNKLKTIVGSSNGVFDALSITQLSSSSTFSFFTTEQKKMIREKTSALLALRPNLVVAFIARENLDTGKIYSSDQLKQIAQNAVEQAKAEYPNKEIALLLLNMPKYQQSGYYTHQDNCFNIAYAVSNPSLFKPGTSEEEISLGKPYDTFLSFFSAVKKPYRLHNIYENYNGDLIVKTIDNSSNEAFDVYGFPFVNTARVFVSKNREEYKQKLSAFDNYDEIPENEQVLSYEETEQQLRAFEPICLSERDIYNPNFWVLDETVNNSIENVKERLLDKRRAFWEYDKVRNSEFVTNALLASVGAAGDVSVSSYYDFNATEMVVDPIVYGLIDFFGCIPVVDYFADGAGLLYSTIRGNGTNVVIYSAALATPFVGAVVYKQGQKMVSYFAKKINGNYYEVLAKQLDDNLEGWFKISDEVQVDEDKVGALISDLNNPTNLNKFNQSKRKAAYDYAKANVDEVVDDLADAWINGWTKEQVLAIPKPNRPNTNVYLKQSYRNAHEAVFNQEGGAFIVVKVWIEEGGYAEFPLNKYAMLRSDMNEVIANFRATGNTDYLEDALGYSRGDLQGLENELYVFYPSSSNYSFEMPTGNEIGANSLWEPGGETSGGFKEAVMVNKTNPNAQITHNNNIENLKNQFDWEKIQQ
jgi:hypothetical protein